MNHSVIKRQNTIETLKQLGDQHAIWNNPLLRACSAGELTFSEFQYLFSQYYLYCKSFTRFLAAFMVNCENDLHRSKLTENLWEESGEIELEERHAEIFRNFLKKHLNIKELDKINFEEFTTRFINDYLALCLHSKSPEAASALSLGTERIVPRLYQIFRQGLLKAGLSDDALLFFNLHIVCDDAHAITLEKIVLDYQHEENWFERSGSAMKQALDLRNLFFTKIYQRIIKRRLESLTACVREKPEKLFIPKQENLIAHTRDKKNVLYSNTSSQKNIDFTVQRVPFASDILDPRLVSIPPGCDNEYHSHAHETVFLILEGVGEIIIENRKIQAKTGDVVFVPRWLGHQTRNIGNEAFKYFAVTDYGFTGRFPQNSETAYRMNPENVQAA